MIGREYSAWHIIACHEHTLRPLDQLCSCGLFRPDPLIRAGVVFHADPGGVVIAFHHEDVVDEVLLLVPNSYNCPRPQLILPVYLREPMRCQIAIQSTAGFPASPLVSKTKIVKSPRYQPVT